MHHGIQYSTQCALALYCIFIFYFFYKCRRSFGQSMHSENLHTVHRVHITYNVLSKIAHAIANKLPPPPTKTNGSCSYRAAHPWREACFQRETESWGALQSEELKQTQSVIFTKWHQAPLMKHTLSPSLCPHVRDWMSKLQHPAINISARIVLVSPVLSFLFSTWLLTFFPPIHQSSPHPSLSPDRSLPMWARCSKFQLISFESEVCMCLSLWWLCWLCLFSWLFSSTGLL